MNRARSPELEGEEVVRLLPMKILRGRVLQIIRFRTTFPTMSDKKLFVGEVILYPSAFLVIPLTQFSHNILSAWYRLKQRL